ncbi:MAG: UPF0280 family protein [Candidatus Methanoliparum thermophilum]|uniref:UPF0280 protein EF806_03785 n=1 Tax=Methanoliparum thermophilum TaxID=2491083 RepID=A0A520KRR0_METT2|nr:MAG: UPF0280 family protein [Candidatus Methanoliparum thermophilum]
MRVRFNIKETNVSILSNEERYIDIAKKAIISARMDLEDYIKRDPFFYITFEPYQPKKDVPDVVKRMLSASEKVGVGPMAAVAGTIAWIAVEKMRMAGSRYAIVDNGGDIAIINDKVCYVGIYAGSSPISCKYAFEIEPRDDIIGICTSSGRVGPSISLGDADAVTVFSKDVSLADAAATAFGNFIHNDFNDEIKKIESIMNENDDIIGSLVVQNEKVALLGDLPLIVSANVDKELITKPY